MQLIATSLAIGIMAGLSGCITAANQPYPADCTTMECVALGEAQDAGPSPGDFTVRPIEILEDSRCPIDGECVWPGRVRVKAELRLGYEVTTVILSTDEPLRINAGMLSIAEVVPFTSTSWMPISPELYRLGFTFAPDIMEQPQPEA